MWYDSILESDKIPDVLIRTSIRRRLAQRLKEEDKGNAQANLESLMQLIASLKQEPIAVETAAANEQHYEVPSRFYQLCLGKHLKYSSGYWNESVQNLDQAEYEMLELTCSRAELENGQDILELGCGWGSLSLFMASCYPDSRITAVSNSRTQKAFIDTEAAKRGFKNLTVLTADMNTFQIAGTYDRIVSVEMFEHMRNYELLLKKIAAGLKRNGKLFVHIFTHFELAYKFEVKDQSDWMSRYFFTGGIMPSDHLLLYFNTHFAINQHWRLSGIHYSKTAEAWLDNMDNNKHEIIPLFESVYGKKEALKWWVYWRIFYMSCAELWSYNKGETWMVSHYLFEKR